MIIETRHDSKRGCGFRNPGGLYLMAGGLAAPCGKLPFPLISCPTCSAGIKFSRGWTWIDADALFMEKPCSVAGSQHCGACPLSTHLFGKAGLLWIGEAFYKTPSHFIEESHRLGISRRISGVPREFELGKTWVMLAHIKAMPHPTIEGEYLPAIFQMFKPASIEYVTKGDETTEELEQMQKRGITPVKVQFGGAEVAA